jgi:isopenicillin N synthase-like dioxygenase
MNSTADLTSWALLLAAVFGVDLINGFLSPVSIVGRPITLTAHELSESEGMIDFRDRPLLKKFGQDIRRRVNDSAQGQHRKGKVGAYTSKEMIPRLDMQCSTAADGLISDLSIASRQEIREAFSESETTFNSQLHGRSSGSGCAIIRLQGEDAVAMHKLVRYADKFFDRVDTNEGKEMSDVGVFRVANHVYVGFDEDVNDGKMQFLDTRIFTYSTEEDRSNATILPMELQNLMGSTSMNDAHNGMNTLLDIGSQITSAVLQMNSKSAKKLIDDGTSVVETTQLPANQVSNSYHRLIRYLKPDENATGAAFEPHIDSTFLTMIPMPKLPGLEVWCPSRSIKEGIRQRGEWVRPTLQSDEHSNDDNAYIIVMAGHFLELTSDGKVPTCIHRVVPPPHKNTCKYQPRVSSPLFLRPRRGEEATLDLDSDLRPVSQSPNAEPMTNGLYHEKGLLDECNEMHLWSAHDVMRL